MNEVFQVLMYLFERHMEEDCSLPESEQLLTSELQEVGFHTPAITKALDWLNGLVELQRNAELHPFVEHNAHRVFIPWECQKLDERCRGFIILLEQIGILSPITRELVIDRLMALELDEIDLPQVKWVALMVLFNQPDKAAALACMERLVLGEALGSLH